MQWQSRPGHTAVNAWVMGIKYFVVETGKVIQDSGEMILLQWERALGEQKTCSDGQGLLVLLRMRKLALNFSLPSDVIQ